MNQIIALAVKDLRLLLRDKAGLFFTFFFPFIMAGFFGVIFSGQNEGGSAEMTVVIVDEDGTDGSRAFVRRLDESPELRVWTKWGDGSDRPLTREDGAGFVQRGKVAAYLVLPKGFGAQISRPFSADAPAIETGIDPSRRAEAGMLQGVLTKYLFEGMQDLFSDPEKMRAYVDTSLAELDKSDDVDPVQRAALKMFLPAVSQFFTNMPAGNSGMGGMKPVELKETGVARDRSGPRSSYEFSFPQGVVWGMVGCAAAFGISLVTERGKGTLVRLRMAPISSLHILAGKALACFVMTMTLATLLLLCGHLFFGVQIVSLPLLAAAVLCASVAFVGIMMFLSVLGRTEQSASGIGWAILMVMSMVGGGMVPLFIMPGWMQSISNVSPVKWAIYGIEGAIWRGLSAEQMLISCVVLLGVGGVFFAIGARAFNWLEQS